MTNKETELDTLGIGAGMDDGLQPQIDDGRRPGSGTGAARRIAELEREVRELRRANEILEVYFARELEVGLEPPPPAAGDHLAAGVRGQPAEGAGTESGTTDAGDGAAHVRPGLSAGQPRRPGRRPSLRRARHGGLAGDGAG